MRNEIWDSFRVGFNDNLRCQKKWGVPCRDFFIYNTGFLRRRNIPICLLFSLFPDFHKTIPGFNSTLRQGNITHHEYIQVRCIVIYACFGHINILGVLKTCFLMHRLERAEMLGWTRLPYLKVKLLVGMESKFWAGIYTGLVNFSTSLGCFLSSSRLLVFTSAQWYQILSFFVLLLYHP